MKSTYQKLLDAEVRHRVRCLPLVYIAGFLKSGTSDLRASLAFHPDLLEAFPVHYFKSAEYHKQSTVKDYIDIYDGAANSLSSQPREVCSSKQTFYPGLIYEQEEGFLFSFNGAFEKFPWNKGHSEPSVHMLHALRLLVPQAKLLIVFRSPEDRLYSSYKQYTKPLSKQSPEHFHSVVLEEINLFKKCIMNNYSLSHCLYPNVKQRLRRAHDPRRSLYYGYMLDVFKIFPRRQVHVIKSEEFFKNRVVEMRKVCQFLSLKQLDASTEAKLLQKPVSQLGATRYVRQNITEPKGMLPSTRNMLQSFYKPWNDKLEQLLDRK